jgi:NADH-ubiquinone oxidoreductase subunit F-like iron-sulfur protein
MSDTALCQLERIAPRPILSTLDRFADEYRAHAERGVCLAGACATPEVPPLLQPVPGLDSAPITGRG